MKTCMLHQGKHIFRHSYTTPHSLFQNYIFGRFHFFLLRHLPFYFHLDQCKWNVLRYAFMHVSLEVVCPLSSVSECNAHCKCVHEQLTADNRS